MITPELSRSRAARPEGPGPTGLTPYLALDVPAAVERYRSLTRALGPGVVHYAVKANPHPSLVAALVAAGARFDVASAGEVELCLAAGARPQHLLCSNPVQRRGEIERAFRRGARLFVADSPDEVRKLARTAPAPTSWCG